MPEYKGRVKCAMTRLLMRPANLVLLLIVFDGGFTSAQDSRPNRIANPSPAVPTAWLTLAERSGFRKTPRYDEVVGYCKRLADASEWIDYQSFGMSPEGRSLPLVIVSKDRLFTPAAAQMRGQVALDDTLSKVQNIFEEKHMAVIVEGNDIVGIIGEIDMVQFLASKS